MPHVIERLEAAVGELAGARTRIETSVGELEKIHSELLTLLGQWTDLRAKVLESNKRVNHSKPVPLAHALCLIRGGKA